MAETAQFKIESDVPAPSSRNGRSYKYPFAEMNVGDSFLISDGSGVEKIRYAASYYGSRNQKKFAVRKCDSGHRCWRIA